MTDPGQFNGPLEFQATQDHLDRINRKEVQRYYAPLKYEEDSDSVSISRMVPYQGGRSRGGVRSIGGGRAPGQQRPKFHRQPGAASAHRVSSITPQDPRTAARTSSRAGQDSLFRSFKDAMEASKGAFNRSVLKPRPADVIRGGRDPAQSVVGTTVISSQERLALAAAGGAPFAHSLHTTAQTSTQSWMSNLYRRNLVVNNAVDVNSMQAVHIRDA